MMVPADILRRMKKERQDSGAACKRCGQYVEAERYVYAIPVCYACLPPPEPLPVAPISDEAKHLLGRDQ